MKKMLVLLVLLCAVLTVTAAAEDIVAPVMEEMLTATGPGVLCARAMKSFICSSVNHLYRSTKRFFKTLRIA